MHKKDIPSAKHRPHPYVLASNDSLIFENNPSINLDSLLDVIQGKNESEMDSAYVTIQLNNTEYRIYIRTIQLPSKKDFKLILITSLDRHFESLAQLRYILFIISPLALLIFGIIGFFIARRSFAPVSNITRIAASISSESLDKRVPIGKSQDELSHLANTFNEMISRLDITFKSHQRFIADASHDFRTPLTVIQMEIELLLGNNEIDEKTKEVLENCLKEIHSLNKLSDNLLFLAKSDAKRLTLNKKLFRLDELIIDCVTKLDTLAQTKNISFRIDSKYPVEITADKELITRALINIIDNAIKYSCKNEIIVLSLDKDNKQTIITIINKGNPIPIDLLPDIFNRFQRGDKSRTSGGFGLGLSIVKAIIESHSGLVTVTSEEERGTSFRIKLPI
jgi:heavy metal sensor kinase